MSVIWVPYTVVSHKKIGSPKVLQSPIIGTQFQNPGVLITTTIAMHHVHVREMNMHARACRIARTRMIIRGADRLLWTERNKSCQNNYEDERCTLITDPRPHHLHPWSVSESQMRKVSRERELPTPPLFTSAAPHPLGVICSPGCHKDFTTWLLQRRSSKYRSSIHDHRFKRPKWTTPPHEVEGFIVLNK